MLKGAPPKTQSWKSCLSALTSTDIWSSASCLTDRLPQHASTHRWPCGQQRLASSGSTQHFSVLIAGAGPTGLTLSILLGKLGIPSLVVDKSSGLPNHPQAHFINNRSMEIFRPMDGLAAEVAAHSPPLAEWRKFVYCESLTGRVFGEVDHFQGQTDPRMHDLSPEPVVHLSQHKLLPLMLHRAQERGGQDSIRFGHHLQHFQQSPDGITCTVHPSQGSPYQVQARYLIAADGASSRVRKQLGIDMVGEAAMQHLVNIHFFSKDLWHHVKERPAMLYFVFSSQAIVVLIAHNLQEGEMVAQVPYFPPVQSLADFPASTCRDILRKAAGLPNLELDVRTVKTWNMSAQVAQRFQEGRVFLAGDAAHRFPPAGAFGMNTGIQDAHNLAWKLAAVLNNTASPKLLNSYQAERKPVAQANTDLSVANWHEAVKVPKVLGLDPRAANLLNAVVGSGPMSLLPKGFGRAALDFGLAAGLSVSGLYGPLKQSRERQLSSIFASGQTLRLQFPKEDLGFVYNTPGAAICAETNTALCASHRPCAQPQADTARADATAVNTKDRVHKTTQGSVGGSDRRYRPSCAPGSRLPHCTLRQLNTDGSLSGTDMSTLDLLSVNKWRLLLLIRSGPLTAAWLEAVNTLEAELSCPIRAVSVVAPHQGAAVPSRLNGQALETFVDVNNSWPDLSGVSETGAVLVRPDGHVLWRRVDAADVVSKQHREERASRLHAVNAASEATTPSHDIITSDVHCIMTAFRSADPPEVQML
ncbi:TPA: hypothetical protein ACH3X1_001346 [Trebouxia sp. C0004]